MYNLFTILIKYILKLFFFFFKGHISFEETGKFGSMSDISFEAHYVYVTNTFYRIFTKCLQDSNRWIYMYLEGCLK